MVLFPIRAHKCVTKEKSQIETRKWLLWLYDSLTYQSGIVTTRINEEVWILLWLELNEEIFVPVFIDFLKIRHLEKLPSVPRIYSNHSLISRFSFRKIVSKKKRFKQNFMTKRRVLFEAISSTSTSDIATFIAQVAKIIDVGSGIENSTGYAEYLRIKTTLLIHLQQQNLKVMDVSYSDAVRSYQN